MKKNILGAAMPQFRQIALIPLLTAALYGQQYVVSTIAGGAAPASARAVDVVIGEPASVTTDGAGNVYFTSLDYVLKLDTAGNLERVAGNARCDPMGDGGPARAASMSISAVVSDADGNLFLADNLNHRIRKIAVDGTITSVVAGADGSLGTMSALALAADGSLFVADVDNRVVRKVTADGEMITVAGGGTNSSDEPRSALEAKLGRPSALATDGDGNVYFADSRRIYKLSPDGMLTTIAGLVTGPAVEGGPAATAAILEVGGIVADRAGNIFFSEYDPYYWVPCTFRTCTPAENRIKRISKDGTLTTVAGTVPLPSGFPGDGGPALAARLFLPMGLAFDVEGNLLVADSKNGRIRKISLDGIISTVAGNGQRYRLLAGDGGPAASAALYTPSGLAFDQTGNLYIADSGNDRVRKISRDGVISTFAGTGGLSNSGSSSTGFSGDGGPAAEAMLSRPAAVAVDREGSVFIADSGNNRIRKVSADGVISTIAGTGRNWFPGGVIALIEPLPTPVSLAVDNSGNLFISTNYKAVYKLSRDGRIRLVTDQVYGPIGLAVDGSDSLFIADSGNSRVLRVLTDGSIATVAGIPYPGYLAFDRAGNLFITGGGQIRKASRDGVITTIARPGEHRVCLAGDGALAVNTDFSPAGLAIDADGNLYESEGKSPWDRNVIRMLRPIP